MPDCCGCWSSLPATNHRTRSNRRACAWCSCNRFGNRSGLQPQPRPRPQPPGREPCPHARTANRPERLPHAAASATEAVSGYAVAAAESREQGHQGAREHSPPGLAAAPLRRRRAQLPGGDHADAFRMRPPPSPKRVRGFIARAFGDPGPPCPRIQANIAACWPRLRTGSRGCLRRNCVAPEGHADPEP